jgi:hypothetical protein
MPVIAPYTFFGIFPARVKDPDLSIPGSCIELLIPRTEFGQLIWRQLFYRLFNFFNCSRHFYTSVFVAPNAAGERRPTRTRWGQSQQRGGWAVRSRGWFGQGWDMGRPPPFLPTTPQEHAICFG